MKRAGRGAVLTGLETRPHRRDAFAELVLRLPKFLERAGEVLEFVVELLLDGREVVGRECRQVDWSGGGGVSRACTEGVEGGTYFAGIGDLFRKTWPVRGVVGLCLWCLVGGGGFWVGRVTVDR